MGQFNLFGLKKGTTIPDFYKTKLDEFLKELPERTELNFVSNQLRIAAEDPTGKSIKEYKRIDVVWAEKVVLYVEFLKKG
jgi:hypothetical protein